MGCGTVFSVNPKTGAQTVVYSFLGRTDGKDPNANLIDVNGTLYGTTYNGGGHNSCLFGCGTVFSVNPGTGAETVIHSFGRNTDGTKPGAGLIDVKGTLYGTTPSGGKYCTGNYPPGCGTVFAIAP